MDNETLVLDFLEWLGEYGKPYPEVMRAWRSSCPRLAIWEDAAAARLVATRDRHVSVTSSGRAFLEDRRDARRAAVVDGDRSR